METHTGTARELFDTAAQHVATTITSVLDAKGSCTLGIVGGRTVPGLFKALERHVRENKQGIVDIFWLDERVAEEKNFTSVLPHLEQLSEKLAIQWHPFVSTDKQEMFEEIGTAEERLEALGTAFDIVVLSAGEDGHVSSLFPNHPVLTADGKQWTFVDNAPKPPPVRVTVTVPLLLTAQHAVLFFIDKKDVYARFTNDKVTWQECPAKLVERIPDAHVFVSDV